MLQSQYQIAFSVFGEMATELETAKIRVKEDTPIFSVIEEATIPNGESKPDLEKATILWGFLGFVIGVTWILAGRLMGKARIKWKELNE